MMRSWLHRWKSPVIGIFHFVQVHVIPRGYGSYLEINNSQLEPDFLEYFSETYRKMRGWKSLPEEHILLVIDEAQVVI